MNPAQMDELIATDIVFCSEHPLGNDVSACYSASNSDIYGYSAVGRSEKIRNSAITEVKVIDEYRP